MEIRDHVKEELEKMEVTQSRVLLKAQREALLEADRRMQEAKELTKELLNHHNNDWADLIEDEHSKRMECDRGQIRTRTLIAPFEDAAPA